MRKRVVGQDAQTAEHGDHGWLDLDNLTQVELSSEAAAHPIEAALTLGTRSGWRATQPGKQTIRIRFDVPQRITRIHLEFEEDGQERTQQFVLRWSSDDGPSNQEIVRQQYNFSPPHARHEVEDYNVDLCGLTTIELEIIPDIGGGPVCASLSRLLLA